METAFVRVARAGMSFIVFTILDYDDHCDVVFATPNNEQVMNEIVCVTFNFESEKRKVDSRWSFAKKIECIWGTADGTMPLIIDSVTIDELLIYANSAVRNVAIALRDNTFCLQSIIDNATKYDS